MINGGHEGVGSAEDLVVPDDPNISEDWVVVAEPNTPPGTHRTPGWIWMGSADVGDERGDGGRRQWDDGLLNVEMREVYATVEGEQ